MLFEYMIQREQRPELSTLDTW